MRTKIYILCETNDIIRYVGKTSQTLVGRLQAHILDAKKGDQSHRCQWIRYMLKRETVPKIKQVDEVDGDGNEEEREWIAFYMKEGFLLTNGTGGGDEDYVYRERKEFWHKKYKETQKKAKAFHPHKIINLFTDSVFSNATQYLDELNYENRAIMPYKKPLADIPLS